MGFSGIYAVFSDRATTGSNGVSSGALQRVAELKIAVSTTPPACDAGAFVDDLATGIITASDVQPGWESPSSYICLRNEGSGDLAVTWSAIDLVDVENDCTGDEAAAGDTTCASGAFGELSPHILIYQQVVDCATAGFIGFQAGYLDEVAVTGISPGVIAAGADMCLTFRAGYGGTAADTLTLTEKLLAQSDQVSWRFAFDGVAQYPRRHGPIPTPPRGARPAGGARRR
jgi:hypothetical protein